MRWSVSILGPILLCALAATAREPDARPHAKTGAVHGVSVLVTEDTKGDLVAIAKEIVTKHHADTLAIVDTEESRPEAKAFVHVQVFGGEDYAPPESRMVRLFGVGLSPEHVERIGKTDRALFLGFVAPPGKGAEALVAFDDAALRLALRLKGLLLDETTRQYFAPSSWASTRGKGWLAQTPDVTFHITIHAYPEDGLMRAVTLGMAKFGCPDLVVNGFARTNWNRISGLVNLVAQTLVEHPGPTLPSRLTLDIRSLKKTGLRKKLLDSLEEGATGRAVILLRPTKPDEGDPDNRLLEIAFEGPAGKTVQERHEALIDRLFGSTDSIEYVTHDEAIQAASRRARKRLIEVKKPRFLKGLPPRERLLVKSPFATPDGGNEWMWVEVTAWKGTVIHGLLMNRPFHIPGLKAGAKVEVKEEKVFDYMHEQSDGTVEGNETAELIRKRSGGK